MRAGFEVYRAFRQDDEDVKSLLQKYGKYPSPVLATGGDAGEFVNVSEAGAFRRVNRIEVDQLSPVRREYGQRSGDFPHRLQNHHKCRSLDPGGTTPSTCRYDLKVHRILILALNQKIMCSGNIVQRKTAM